MNDLIFVDFEERDPRQGVIPHDIAALGKALRDAIAGQINSSFSEAVEVALVAAQPGSLRLAFRAVLKEFKKAPLATGLAVFEASPHIVDAIKHLVAALVSLELAAVAPPADEKDLVTTGHATVHSSIAAQCFELAAVLREIEPGTTLVRAPECPAILLTGAATRSRVKVISDLPGPRSPDHQWFGDGPAPFSGRLNVDTVPERLTMGGNQVSVFMGRIMAGRDNKTKRVLVIWAAPEQMPDTKDPPVIVRGQLYSAASGPKKLRLETARPGPEELVIRADAILLVRDGSVFGLQRHLFR